MWRLKIAWALLHFCAWWAWLCYGRSRQILMQAWRELLLPHYLHPGHSLISPLSFFALQPMRYAVRQEHRLVEPQGWTRSHRQKQPPSRSKFYCSAQAQESNYRGSSIGEINIITSNSAQTKLRRRHYTISQMTLSRTASLVIKPEIHCMKTSVTYTLMLRCLQAIETISIPLNFHHA